MTAKACSKANMALHGQPIEGSDPTPWQMRNPHTQHPLDLAGMAVDFSIINLACAASGQSLATHLIANGEGGYLITLRSKPATSLRLNITERGVDWARR